MSGFPVASGTYAVSGIPGVATQAGTGSAPTPTDIWRFNAPAGDTTGNGGLTHGPFRLFVGGASFQSTFDRVMYLGYNADDGGGRYVGTEPKFTFQIESDYDDGTHRNLEIYLEYAKAGTVTVADGVTTNGSPTVTSATAGFKATAHVGMSISGTGIPANSYIGVVNSPSSIGLSSSAGSNVPVNATASGSALTLTIGPSGATSYRPFFWQINRANGVLHMEMNSTTGISFNTTDGNATNWGALGPSGLSISPLAGQSANLTLGWVSGAQNSISVGNDTLALLIQPTSAGTQPWRFQVGSVAAAALSTHGWQAGDLNTSNKGVLTATPTTADKDTLYNLYLQAQASQSTQLLVASASNGTTLLWYVDADGTQHMGVNGQSTIVGKAIPTASTDGFLYIPTCAGSPTGTPTARTGTVPLIFDTTNRRLYVYESAAWHYFAETA